MNAFFSLILIFNQSQVLTELKSDNQRLKDENGALIRVISKLSKWGRPVKGEEKYWTERDQIWELHTDFTLTCSWCSSSRVKGVDSPKNIKFCHNLLMSLQTGMAFFLLWNTKEDILRNVSVFFVHTMKVSHHQNCWLQHASKYLILCSREESKHTLYKLLNVSGSV